MSYTYRPLLDASAPTPPLPATERREKRGVVYTKPWVVDLMLDLAGYRAENDLGGMLAIEPAAGDGNFLVPMVERLVASCQRHGRSVTECGGSLLALELNPDAATRSRTLVRSALAQRRVSSDEAVFLSDRWVQTGDYLLNAPRLPAADVIIGNPPYIRLEDMEHSTAATYRKHYRTMVGRACTSPFLKPRSGNSRLRACAPSSAPIGGCSISTARSCGDS